ncbi:MAG: PHP domain-containing protein, partial [Acidobacteria bacterium]|nr:PHP domain-containing protein [Acidobacteriota bacterium]
MLPEYLFLQSHYSLMWGTAPPEALAEQLVQQGQAVFPLTDRNGLYGLVRHLQVCEEHGLRPVIGCELVAADAHAFVLVKTQQGYRNLSALLTDFYQHGGGVSKLALHTEHGARRVVQPTWRLIEQLAERHSGLVVVSDHPDLLETLNGETDGYIDLHLSNIEAARA